MSFRIWQPAAATRSSGSACDPAPELATDTEREQYQQYAWFFQYVNERLFALAARHSELALADWRAVSNVLGITKDLIQLNAAGVTSLTNPITSAVLRATPWA